ncbi:MAG: hypothetical protein GTN69_07060 [Armatimonadetes bacterium]|nr:hypothetical protein [Armatimonadota bacterium]
MYEEVKIKMIGEPPGLLMHNPRLADPLDEYAKALKKISGKRKKTEEDHIKMGNVEFLGSLYLDDDDNPVLTADIIHATLENGAKNWKLGKVAKGAIQIFDDAVLSFSGPKDMEKRIEDPSCRLRKSVRVGQTRIIRTRPLFRNWSCVVPVMVDTARIEREQLIDIAEYAGRIIGVCDWRPRYGRFSVEVLNE